MMHIHNFESYSKLLFLYHVRVTELMKNLLIMQIQNIKPKNVGISTSIL